MILTVSKPVNARIGRPSVNAPNPKFYNAGDHIRIRGRVIGDIVNGNNIWILTEENEFLTEEGFHSTADLKKVPFYVHLENFPELFTDLGISQLWNLSRGEKVNIGIIDNGVANHPSLRGKVKELNPSPLTEPTLNNHATTMACIIGSFDETDGKIGISPMVENIYSYAINIDTVQPSELITAIDMMVEHKVNVINMSFASNRSVFFPPNTEALKLQKRINQLVENDCLIVCASGNNHGRNNDFYPAKYQNVISVAGYDLSGNLDWNSNLWNGISICAPSEKHYFNDDHERYSNGTSSAAAIVTGCITCIYNSLEGGDKIKSLNSKFSKLQRLLFDYKQMKIYVPKLEIATLLQTLNT